MINILNITPHLATPDQLNDGVVELSKEDRETLMALFVFDTLPTGKEIIRRARTIKNMAVEQKVPMVMIGGPAWILSPLAELLWENGIIPVFPYEQIITEETVTESGLTIRTAKKVHAGWIRSVR